MATFCYNINRDLPIHISNRKVLMNFYYIDDVIDSFIAQLTGSILPDTDGIYRLSEKKIINITLGDVADRLYYFRECQKSNTFPQLNNIIDERLWRTYLSYAEES